MRTASSAASDVYNSQVIGPSKNYNNVFYSFGHHHLGWTLAAISGKIISKMIANENTNLDLEPYSSLRFS